MDIKCRDYLIKHIENNEQICPEFIDAIFEYLKALVKDCDEKNGDILKEDAIFLLLSSILSKKECLSKPEFLKKCYIFLRGFHTEDEKLCTFSAENKSKDYISIVATGAEKEIRTTLITPIIGLLTSMFYPTIVQGNRSVTGCFCGHCAETDIMENMGYNVTLKSSDLIERLKEIKTNFAYFNAQIYHPALRRFSNPRGYVGFRDVWKLMACFADPLNTKYRYIAMWTYDYIPIIKKMINDVDELKDRCFLLVSNDKIDEYIKGDYYLIDKGLLRKQSAETNIKSVDCLKNLSNKDWDFLTELKILTWVIMKILRICDNEKEVDKKLLNYKITDDVVKKVEEIAIINAALVIKQIPEHNKKDLSEIKKDIINKIPDNKERFIEIFKNQP